MDDPVYDVVVFTPCRRDTHQIAGTTERMVFRTRKGGSTCIGPSSSLQGAKQKYETAIAHLQDKDGTVICLWALGPRLIDSGNERSSAE